MQNTRFFELLNRLGYLTVVLCGLVGLSHLVSDISGNLLSGQWLEALTLIILSFVMYEAAGLLFTTVMHRQLHGAFRLTGWWIISALIASYLLGALCSFAAWLEWHEYHHGHTDQPEDKTSPQVYGLFYPVFYWFFLRPVTGDKRARERLVARLRPPKPVAKIVHILESIWLLLPLTFLLLTSMRSELLFELFSVCIVGAQLTLLVFNNIGHQAPESHYSSGHSSNVGGPLLSVVMLGEAKHQNHHRFPANYLIADSLFEDPGAMVILVFVKLGIATF